MKLEFPQEKHKKAYEELIEEWLNINEAPRILSSSYDFERFLREIKLYKTKSPTWINVSLYFLVEWKEIVWALDIRHHINHPNLIEKWWHIWYWIAPKFRRKWYATKMLELGLVEAKKIWLEKVLITCDSDNIWSKKVIERNWWIFERLTKDWVSDRYWIEL